MVIGLLGLGLFRQGCEIEQFAGESQVFGASAIGKEPIVADAVEALGQDVEQEASDELVGIERHDLLAVSSFGPVILPFEGDALIVETDQTTVRDGNPVGIARDIGEHRLGAGEGALCVDHPCDRRSPGKEDGNVT